MYPSYQQQQQQNGLPVNSGVPGLGMGAGAAYGAPPTQAHAAAAPSAAAVLGALGNISEDQKVD